MKGSGEEYMQKQQMRMSWNRDEDNSKIKIQLLQTIVLLNTTSSFIIWVGCVATEVNILSVQYIV